MISERLWRRLKHEWLIVREYASPEELEESLGEFQRQYNSERPHQGLDYETPDAVYERGEISMEKWQPRLLLIFRNLS